MKNDLLNMVILIICLYIGSSCAQKEGNEFTELSGPYLGQKPPGMSPKIFAPGIISTDAMEGSVSFNRNNTIFLFARRDAGIFIMQQFDGRWTVPELAPFSVGDLDWDFVISPDDENVFISSRRPEFAGGDTLQVYRIWTSELRGSNWSAPELLPAPVNTGQHDCFPSITEDGTLYFFSNRDEGLGNADIYRSKKTGNEYPEVENLGSPINTSYRDLDAYVDPKESYLIFCSNRPGGIGKTDLYISFRTAENTWSEPVNMGKEINSENYEVIPYVTPDRKYFFFTSDRTGNGEIYWVDASIIEEFKPEDLK